MPETYTTMNTDHIATFLSETTHTTTTGEVEHCYEVTIAPETLRSSEQYLSIPLPIGKVSDC